MREGKKFRVFFDEVPAKRIEVSARTESEALLKATKEWQKTNGWPRGGYVYEPETGDVYESAAITRSQSHEHHTTR